MKIIKQKIIRKACILFFMLMPFLTAIAQEDEFEDDVQDVPAAPIDNYILIAIALAIYIAYQFLKTQPKKNKVQ